MILVDSDVLIANLRGVDQARDWLRGARTEYGRLAVSVLTNAEILGGKCSPERHAVGRLLGSLESLPVTDPIARRAGELRRRHHGSHSAIGLVDYLIAATAQIHGLEFATLNVKHFPMFVDLEPAFRFGS